MYYSEHSAKSPCYDDCYKVKQATCAFQFVCKHTELKHAIFPKLWLLHGLKQEKWPSRKRQVFMLPTLLSRRRRNVDASSTDTSDWP